MDTKTENPLTIAKLIQNLPRLRTHEAAMEDYEELYTYENKFPCADPNSFIGIEVEVEGITRFTRSFATPYWMMKEDGSLRNYGKEFVSHPLKAKRAEQALTNLWDLLPTTADFSERTSIHIHLNVRTFTFQQIETFILTYMLFEKVLFSFVHPSRYKSIFCVPICETRLGESIKKSIAAKIPNFSWSKYTALNLLPIQDKGTIEFRHLQGTSNKQRIIEWINIILCIKKFAFKNSCEYIKERIFNLNTTSQYVDIGNEVFGPYFHLLDSPDYPRLMEECDSYIKEHCFINPFINVLTSISPKSPLSVLTEKTKPIYYDPTQFITQDNQTFTIGGGGGGPRPVPPPQPRRSTSRYLEPTQVGGTVTRQTLERMAREIDIATVAQQLQFRINNT